MFVVPLVLLAVAAFGQVGVAKAYWGEGYWGSQIWGSYGQSWYYQLKQAGYSQGYDDGSKGNQYDCSGHTSVYCASYGHGYADGQAQYNQDNQQPAQNQGQQQSSSSTSYSQSNPNVKVIINNVIPSSNNSTAGAPQNNGTGENN